MGLKKPVFRPDVMERLQPLRSLNNYNCVFSVLHDWVIIMTCIILNNILLRYNVYLGLLFYPLSLLLISGCMRGLANLMHVSTHRALAKSKILNDIIGYVFCGWCILQSWTGYHHNHILLHHPNLGNAEKDPDYQQVLQTGLYRNGTAKEEVVRYLKNIPSIKSTLLFMKYLVKDRVFPKSEKLYETVLRLSFWAAMLAALYQTGNLLNFLFFWVIPMITTANWIGNLSEILEHFPLLHEGVDELHASRNKFCGYILDYFINPHGDAYHLVHHLFPRIPHWNYRKAHEILMEDEQYRELNKCKKSLRALIEDVLSHFE